MADSPSARRLFLHGAHRAVGVPSSSGSVEPRDRQPAAGETRPGGPLEVALIAGPLDGLTAPLLAALRKPLRERLAAHVTEPVAERSQAALSELLPHRGGAAVLLGDTSSIAGEALEAVAQYVQGGGGLVSLAARPDRRQAGRRFQWGLLGAQLIGVAGEPAVPVEVMVEPGAAGHPAGRNSQPSGWSTQTTTAVLPLSADALVLLSVRNGGERRPAAWTRLHGAGRVFATLLGSTDDCRQPEFLEIVTSAVAWAAG